MLLEVMKTAEVLSNNIIRWRPTKTVRVEVMEAVNRTEAAAISLCIAPAGADQAEAGVALKQGTTNGAGFGIQWTGSVLVTPEDEVWAVFHAVDGGDILDLTIKAVSL